ncbi:hypothetical protein [Candidatus Scalindua japonica]|nr:hypothetical protein [Candidatus Scalindua japonica]
MKKIFVISVLVLSISFFVQGSFINDAEAKKYSDHSTAGKVGLVAASTVTTAVYMPFKAAYALLGGVASGLTYAVSVTSESESAYRIAHKAFTGDWYIHPDILTSHKYLHFVGPENKKD